jgi:hypothetical protein
MWISDPTAHFVCPNSPEEVETAACRSREEAEKADGGSLGEFEI